jgi:hypothetical protein
MRENLMKDQDWEQLAKLCQKNISKDDSWDFTNMQGYLFQLQHSFHW